MRAVKMSPKIPAPVTPIASATAITPSGMSSMAPRVERGLAQLSGVARSSRAGTKRNVNAGPTARAYPVSSGLGPCIQVRRTPFLSRMVVMVAVETERRMATRSGESIAVPLLMKVDNHSGADGQVEAGFPSPPGG